MEDDMKKMKNTKKMKKMLGCLFLAASLAFTFVGCGSSQEQAPAPADGQNQAAGSEESAAKEAVTESAKAAENSTSPECIWKSPVGSFLWFR